MKKMMTATLLGILLIGAFGAVVVSAVASNDTQTNDCSEYTYTWATEYMNSSSDDGNFSYCVYYNSSDGDDNFSCCRYYNSNETAELEVETIDEAFEIAKAEVDENVSKDNIYQRGFWWIVCYEDEDGVYTQARIDAVTGDVFTGYDLPAGPSFRCGRGFGAHGFGYCMR